MKNCLRIGIWYFIVFACHCQPNAVKYLKRINNPGDKQEFISVIFPLPEHEQLFGAELPIVKILTKKLFRKLSTLSESQKEDLEGATFSLSMKRSCWWKESLMLLWFQGQTMTYLCVCACAHSLNDANSSLSCRTHWRNCRATLSSLTCSVSVVFYFFFCHSEWLMCELQLSLEVHDGG